MSTAYKAYFYQQDRAYHYANRRPDMTYLIYDEQLLGMDDYLDNLQEYMTFYENTFLKGDMLQQEVPVPN
ncbi:hypothetical protein OKW21_001497 [Catalinimonas alkaloidigena]|uniref:hypothetical protein n=1 Tax=Catalinimonas alkaloidigena TaxID=1075417 RepID=UPI002405342F|nr:hypothetical protein [Catalinimonas alkaloidigena]MDF9796234.1 hypothetical protein [Catalinimonas alkaloidigena]